MEKDIKMPLIPGEGVMISKEGFSVADQEAMSAALEKYLAMEAPGWFPNAKYIARDAAGEFFSYINKPEDGTKIIPRQEFIDKVNIYVEYMQFPPDKEDLEEEIIAVAKKLSTEEPKGLLPKGSWYIEITDYNLGIVRAYLTEKVSPVVACVEVGTFVTFNGFEYLRTISRPLTLPNVTENFELIYDNAKSVMKDLQSKFNASTSAMVDQLKQEPVEDPNHVVGFANMRDLAEPTGAGPAVKPPVGLMPEWRWLELRQQDIFEAMQRYILDKVVIPIEWLTELDKITKTLNERKRDV